jgi:hypothetical protein
MSNKIISVLLGVAGLIIALIGGGLMWVYPEKKWIGWVLVGLGVAVFFGFVIYLIIQVNRKEGAQKPRGTIVNAPHNEFKPQNEFNPHNEVKQSVVVNVSASQPQEHQQAKDDQTKLSAKPDFKVTVPGVLPGLVKLDVNVIRKSKPNGDTVFPIVVAFENIPQPEGFGETDEVWAQISYRDKKFEVLEMERVSSGCWVDEPLPSITFPFRKPRFCF